MVKKMVFLGSMVYPDISEDTFSINIIVDVKYVVGEKWMNILVMFLYKFITLMEIVWTTKKRTYNCCAPITIHWQKHLATWIKTLKEYSETIRKTVWGISSAGRALDLHSKGQGFESPILHNQAGVAQWPEQGFCKPQVVGSTPSTGSNGYSTHI